ncbi:MAG: DNA methylase, partial [Clostridia bacterium]|nr:DNA methylase [Clostridia bacterium]
LAKVAMDIVAKHIKADSDGVRIAELNEQSFREKLWEHEPLTDFWRIGHGTKERLEKHGMFCLGDVCLQSVNNEELLYKLFGINAELLINHAWGYESTTIKDIKSYKPIATSLSSGQVLPEGYKYEKTKTIVKEMCDLLVLDLVDKDLVTDQIVLYIGYDVDNLKDKEILEKYKGPIVLDYIGRKVPASAHGSINLGKYTSSTKLILEKTMELFELIINPILLSRRINIVANHTMKKTDVPQEKTEYVQLSFFEDNVKKEQERIKEEQKEQVENKLQKAINKIHKKYGKNSILKGVNYKDGATTKIRNNQIGGHRK